MPFYHHQLGIDRPILTRLEERGLYLEDIVATALELYAPVEGEERDREELKRRLEERIKRDAQI